VGLPVPEVKEAYGCVTTVFRRPDWTGAHTPDQRTGTGWKIIGTAATDNCRELLARLPKLRKDARVNVETVLHELIADKNATIPQICARTGMALRTINNALATLREAGILRAKGYEDNVSTVKTGTSEVISKGKTGTPKAINEVIEEAIKNEPGINKPCLV
jgi:ketosteroid isomerase-like protein